MTIRWSAGDADGNALMYDVFCSMDGGANFHPLFIGLTDTQVEWDTSLVAGTTQGVVRVEASDGVRVSAANSGLFSIAMHAPIARIVSPAAGAVFHQGELVSLRGSAFTAEDGNLPDGHLSWQSSLNGSLGNGALLQPRDLLTGTHLITLTASSGQSGLSATQQISLTIVPADLWADLAVTISGPPRVKPGEVIMYQVGYENHGNFAARGGRITVKFPWDYVGSTALAQASSAPTVEHDEYSGATILTWDVGVVNPNASGAMTVTVRVPTTERSGDADIVAEGAHPSPEANAGGDAAQVTTQVDAIVYLPVVVK